VLARNQDDHVKNIAFLMDRSGRWRLSPAYDVAYAYNPDGQWTSQHQMSINGKRRGFLMVDLFSLAAVAGIKRARAQQIVDEVANALREWPLWAAQSGIGESDVQRIAHSFRLHVVSD
jgi:serine/threonine-protein kinase HipA